MPKPETERAVRAVRAPERVATQPAYHRAAAANGGRTDYATIRTAQGAQRISLRHLDVAEALWLLSERKKGSEDHGVTPAELAEHLGVERADLTTALTSLKRGRLVRTHFTHGAGYGSTTRLYPASRALAMVLAMARSHEMGLQFSLGRTKTAWKNRGTSEPMNFIQHALLLRGG